MYALRSFARLGLWLPTRGETRHEWRQDFRIFISLASDTVTFTDEPHVDVRLGRYRCLHLACDTRPEEGLELLLVCQETLEPEFLRIKVENERIVSVRLGNFLAHAGEDGALSAWHATASPDSEDALHREIEVLLVTVPEPGDIVLHLPQDGRGLTITESRCLGKCRARNRLEFRVLECEAKDGDWEAVREDDGRHRAAGDDVKVRAEAVHEENDSRYRSNCTKRNL